MWVDSMNEWIDLYTNDGWMDGWMNGSTAQIDETNYTHNRYQPSY